MIERTRWYVSALGCSVVLASLTSPIGARSRLTTIDVPGAVSTEATSINDRGDIVGSYQWTDGSRRGFLLVDGVYKTIHVPHATWTEAHGINVRGEIVGTYADAGGQHGFLLSAGRFTTIAAPAGSSPEGINARGQIVGIYTRPGGFGTITSGFLLDSAGFRTFGIVGPTEGTFAHGINARGEIVGGFFNQPEVSGFLLNEPDASTIGEVGTPIRIASGPNAITVATGINDRTTIVGVTGDSGAPGGFVRDEEGTVVYLNVPGATLTRPNGINNLDEIVGAYVADDITHGFLFTDRAPSRCHDRHEKEHGRDGDERGHDRSDAYCDDH